MQKYAIIVAGGKGTRMEETVPKQFLLLRAKPILMHTLERFHQQDTETRIILVLPHAEQSRWQKLCRHHAFQIPHQVTNGGDNRTLSVRNGLAVISDDEGLVAIHDGVRPLVDKSIIQYSYKVAAKEGSAVASVALKDSIRWTNVTGDSNKALDRNQYRIVQTPQTFLLSRLREAYNKVVNKTMTDDASVYEWAGYTVHLIEGSYRNIKVTTPEDLRIAEALLK